MDFDGAIRAHVDWKLKLYQLANGTLKETVDIAKLERNDQCALGKWLAGEGRSLVGSDPKFADLIAEHAEFHKQAGHAAKLIAAGQGAEAKKVVDADVARLSVKVVGKLMELKTKVLGSAFSGAAAPAASARPGASVAPGVSLNAGTAPRPGASVGPAATARSGASARPSASAAQTGPAGSVRR